MKVFMIGGTGLLGSEAARVLIERGHEVTSVALPPLPQGAVLPAEMKIEYGNYLEFNAILLRTEVEFDASTMKIITVSNENYTKDDICITFGEDLKATVSVDGGAARKVVTTKH